jgi:hypothetical protein
VARGTAGWKGLINNAMQPARRILLARLQLLRQLARQPSSRHVAGAAMQAMLLLRCPRRSSPNSCAPWYVLPMPISSARMPPLGSCSSGVMRT